MVTDSRLSVADTHSCYHGYQPTLSLLPWLLARTYSVTMVTSQDSLSSHGYQLQITVTMNHCDHCYQLCYHGYQFCYHGYQLVCSLFPGLCTKCYYMLRWTCFVLYILMCGPYKGPHGHHSRLADSGTLVLCLNLHHCGFSVCFVLGGGPVNVGIMNAASSRGQHAYFINQKGAISCCIV